MTPPGHRTLSEDSSTRMRGRMYGLVVACPFDQCNPPDCPLCAVRKRPMSERFAWVESLAPGEMDDFLTKHGKCLHAKEAEEEASG
jgi:hypothetical protein